MKDTLDNYRGEDEGVVVAVKAISNDGNGVKGFLLTMESIDSLGESSWAIGCRVFRKFMKEWNLHYYARPSESFSREEAYKEAHQKGFRGVVMEDMS